MDTYTHSSQNSVSVLMSKLSMTCSVLLTPNKIYVISLNLTAEHLESNYGRKEYAEKGGDVFFFKSKRGKEILKQGQNKW